MALGKIDRKIVEMMRDARRIKIIIDTDDPSCGLELTFDSKRNDISDFRRNLRLAVQDFLQKSNI